MHQIEYLRRVEVIILFSLITHDFILAAALGIMLLATTVVSMGTTADNPMLLFGSLTKP
jgi:hypothetical protein